MPPPSPRHDLTMESRATSTPAPPRSRSASRVFLRRVQSGTHVSDTPPPRQPRRSYPVRQSRRPPRPALRRSVPLCTSTATPRL